MAASGRHRGGDRRAERAAIGLVAILCVAAWLGFGARAVADDAAALATLKTHCARCHDAGSLENPPAKGALGDILDLSTLAAREDLVVPGDPDASRLYQIMLARHRPLAVFFGPVPGPQASEIAAVRAWLAGLPSAGAACAGRTPLTAEALKRDAQAWRKMVETDAGKPMRFLSLAPLYNLCRDDARMAAYREAVSSVLQRIAKPGSDVQVDTVGDLSVLLAVRPEALGLTAEAWDKLAGQTADAPGIADAGALAARVLSEPATAPVAGAAQAAGSAAGSSAGSVGGLDPIAALASEYLRVVTLARAAAELGETPSGMKDRLGRLQGPHRELGLRLAQSGLDRPSWTWLKSALSGVAAPAAEAAVRVTGPLSLALWTDKLTYANGDLLTIHARASGDCYLTLVAVEASGLATVLFPNDSVTDNLVRAGTVVTVPARDAKYQLRLDKPGRQGLVGICNARAKRPEGIGHDFERQRFTSLGDWRTFLVSTAEREVAYQKAEEEMRKFRARRDGRPEPPAEQLPVGTEDEARAGLSFDVR